MQMKEDELNLLHYWRIILRRWRIILTIFLAVVVIAAVYTYTRTPLYMATSKVLFNLERQTLSFIEGGAAIIEGKDPTEYINTQKEIIRSRAFGDRVVRNMQLDKNPYFIELKNRKQNTLRSKIYAAIDSLLSETETPAPEPKQHGQELDPALTSMVIGRIKLSANKGSEIMQISFYADNPAIAATMANGVTSAFIEHSLEIQVKPYRNSAEWLSAKLVDAKQQLSAKEKTLQQYREGKGVISFDTTKQNVITQQLQELTTQLVQAEAKKHEAEIKYRQIASVINKPEHLTSAPDVLNNTVIQGLRLEELSIKRQISELSERFGPKHFQIIKAQSQLKTIQNSIIAEARKMLNAAKTEYEIAQSNEASIRKTIQAQKQEVLNMTRTAIDFNVIAGEADSNKQFYDLLLKKLQEASLSSGITVSNLQIIDGAATPGSPVTPNRTKNMLLALLVGLFGGVGVAFFIDYLDNTIKTAEDVEQKLALPLLDVIPLHEVEPGKILMTEDPNSTTAEAFRTIRTGLMLSSVVRQLKVILVTSSVPNEGKTTVAANLAVAMAQMGDRVLILDTDMRRHDLHTKFGFSVNMGISDVMTDAGKLASVIKKSDKYPNLDVITGGTHVPNPSELIGSDRIKEFIAAMREQYDRIILDSPPLLAFSDSLLLSSLADGVVLVVHSNKTSRELVMKGVNLLKGINAKILGIALNRIDTTKKSDYYPYYSYYYTDRKDKEEKAKLTA